MLNVILANQAASISELKKNPMAVIAQGDGETVAILNHNKPAFYCVPAELYEALMERIEDMELNAIADSRINEEAVEVNIDDL